jgi:WS/DGAT/MGAT family acyltransferase
VEVVRSDLDAVRRAAHDHGATVNDVVLTAVAGALRTLLASRDEHGDEFVMSVPVSTRQSTDATHLGNEVGVVLVSVPATGPWCTRLAATAAATRAAKQTASSASTSLLGLAFRTLARVGLFRWYVNRQRTVHTFVTNVRGPETPLTFLGARIRHLVPIPVTPGNVTLSFAVLSYAGDLCVTIVADPDTCPDLGVLAEALQDELSTLRRPGSA